MTEKADKVVVEKTPVTLLASPGLKTVLVEWLRDGKQARGYVPNKALEMTEDGKHGLVSPEVLEAATPYGLPWAKLIQLQATPEGIENALHNAGTKPPGGIWTFEDLRTNPMPALGALMATYWLDVGVLLMAAQKFEKGE